MVLFLYMITAAVVIYTLSLHDALPISVQVNQLAEKGAAPLFGELPVGGNGFGCDACEAIAAYGQLTDRKSTRLNSSHMSISYAVFCLKKKKTCDWYNNLGQ